MAVGSGVDLHFPRTAHDYHAEQERHEQEGQVRNHRRRLDFLLAAWTRRRWIEVGVEGSRAWRASQFNFVIESLLRSSAACSFQALARSQSINLGEKTNRKE